MKNFTILFSSILFLTSCSNYLSPYTSGIQKETNLSVDQLKQIQFYLSHTIVLYRNVSNAETEILNGELKVVNGQQIEEIVIESGTPGVVTGKDDDGNLLVSFDSDGSVLRFGVNKGYSGRYTLMAKDWDGRTGDVDYGNKQYKTSQQSNYSYLMISMKQINDTQIASREATGRSLSP
ncbi:MAG: hypothetical protein H7Y00_15135 [Fimbriimonadaceae bacterium]|nr:hypothetical protein [Chitinophagales bacterium]